MIPIMSLGIIFSIILLWMRVQHHHFTLICRPRLNLKNSLISSYFFFQIWYEYFGVSQFFLQHTCHTVLLPIIRGVRNQILFKFIFFAASTFYTFTSLFVPMLLTSSDMGHLTKHFSDVSWLCFRVRLINQCRRRVRKKRCVPLSHPSRLSGLFCSSIENINHWFPEFKHSSTASAVPPWSIQAHYPIRAFEIFTSSFDPLAIHHINIPTDALINLCAISG